ncbi:hypothetical protein QTV49_004640 [Vibrio vulnificus]|nr:hypothetical protein [Vibrio vulnificus]
MRVEIKIKGVDRTLGRKPCANIAIDGSEYSEISEIKFTQSTVGKPYIFLGRYGGVSHENMFFIHGDVSTLDAVYKSLKAELQEHGISFRSVLTD